MKGTWSQFSLSELKWPRFPGAAQHEAKRNGALQTRDRYKLGVCDGPGSAVHRFALHRIRETKVMLNMPDLKTVHLTLPASTADLRKLEIGSVAYLTGRLFTGREGVYKRAVEDGLGMPAGKDALGTFQWNLRPAKSPEASPPTWMVKGGAVV